MVSDGSTRNVTKWLVCGNAADTVDLFSMSFRISARPKLLSAKCDVVGSCKLLDVHDIPTGIVEPTTRRGTPRKSSHHHINVMGNKAIIHSKPAKIPLINCRTLADEPIRPEGVDRQLIEELAVHYERERLRDAPPTDQPRLQKMFHQQTVGLVVFTQPHPSTMRHDNLAY